MRVFLWIIGLIVGIPLALAAFALFMLFVFYPAQHAWNVWRADAANERIWSEGEARVVRVEAELGLPDGTVTTLQSRIVCYQGMSARPWSLKAGAPRRLQDARSAGGQELLGTFPTGATIYYDLGGLCRRVARLETGELPETLAYQKGGIVVPELIAYCGFRNTHQATGWAFVTEAGRLGHPVVAGIEDMPLREAVEFSEMGTSETPRTSSGLLRRWPEFLGQPASSWDQSKECWTRGGGLCVPELAAYCGAK